MNTPSSNPIQFIVQVVKPFRVHLLAMVLVAVILALDFSLRPYILKLILNILADSPQHDIWIHLAWPIGMYFLITLIFESAIQLYHYCVEIKMIPGVRKHIGKIMMTHMVGHSHSYYQNQFTGQLASKINDLTRSVPEVLQIVVDRFLTHTLAMLVAVYTLWIVDPLFAFILMGWVGCFAIVSYFSIPAISVLSNRWSESISHIMGQMVDTLSNMLSIRLFAHKDYEINRMKENYGAAKKAEQRLHWKYFSYWLMFSSSFLIVQGMCLYFLVERYRQGIVSVGDFALILTINLSVSHSFWELAKDFSNFTEHWSNILQALGLTTQPHDIKDVPQVKEITGNPAEIVFDHVTFFHKGDKPLFQDLNVNIEPGKNIGLVGYSGSGKSTFVNLILRLFDVTGGSIKIGGLDIRDIPQDILRKLISFIPQDPSLFHRSLMENIRYGLIDATDEQVIEAAKSAHAHDFIMALPEGYQTMVGERGIKLSGGQRQRIAIARAILKDAPILILDEATSQVDTLTEQLIQDSVEKLMKGKTTLAIAHRLSTLSNMDEIFVFDKGRIVQRGSHEDLLNQDGLFYDLWNAQVAGFIQDE